MKARKATWIMVRLRRETHAKLRRLAELWDYHWQIGGANIPAPNKQCRYGIDEVVAELLRRDDDHRERARKKSKKRDSVEKFLLAGSMVG